LFRFTPSQSAGILGFDSPVVRFWLRTTIGPRVDVNMLISCVVGTRPEVVKMAPVILRLRRSGLEDVRILSTGQHRSLLDQALFDFGLAADLDLDLMRPDQKLADLSARALSALSQVFEKERPGLVLAQGDTSTVFCAALACYYNRVPFGHVEAGLRTGRRYFPFPEEMNRVLVGQLAEMSFAPTAAARQNLLREGIDPASIHVTGNTVIDSLLMTAKRSPPAPIVPSTPRYLLVTAHRRENFGEPLEQICLALLDLVERHPDLSVVFPVHPNPEVRRVLDRYLAGRERIYLLDPVGYPEFVALMQNAYVLLTDSGGVQEEGPALGKPVLVLRDETERPEGVAAGTVQLVGRRREAIVSAVSDLWDRSDVYDRFAKAINPYGDGRAADRIAAILSEKYLLKCGEPEIPIPPWPPNETGTR
jgi:UDP-N-acetylglucosamine 2-epimerase (non-hydrolysing)